MQKYKLKLSKMLENLLIIPTSHYYNSLKTGNGNTHRQEN